MRWVHGRYICGQTWWTYKPASDCSWYWKKLCRVKQVFKSGCDPENPWRWLGGKDYTARGGYDWQLHNAERVRWDKLIWARLSFPRHSFIMWIFIHHRMPTKIQLLKFQPQENLSCALCNSTEEDEQHLYIGCPFAQTLWKRLRDWWPIPPTQSTIEETIKALLKTKGDKYSKMISYAIFSTGIYNIWAARNAALFKNGHSTVHNTLIDIKNHII